MIRDFPPEVGGQTRKLGKLWSDVPHCEGLGARELPQLILPRRRGEAVRQIFQGVCGGGLITGSVCIT